MFSVRVPYCLHVQSNLNPLCRIGLKGDLLYQTLDRCALLAVVEGKQILLNLEVLMD
jgi:hypothetical protein